MNVPDHHPEIQRLKVVCEQHRIQLQECIEEWHRLTIQVRPSLLALYDEAFGDLERERQQLALESTELFRRIELLSIKVQRGEQLTPETIQFVNSVVDAEFHRLHQKLGSERNHEDETKAPLTEKGYSEITQMYRTLAKQYHPDAAGEQADLRQWHQIQDAYVKKDARRLDALCSALCANAPASETEGWTVEQWQEQEQHMAIRCRVENRKLERLLKEEPYSIAKELEDDQWKDCHRASLEADVAARKKELNEQREIYRELTGGMCSPESNPAVTADDAVFAKEFMDSTYFKNR